MDDKMRGICRAGWTIFLFATLAAIGGCSFVGTVLEEQYDMAQNVERGCKAVDDMFILPTQQEIKEELVGRLRTRLTSAYCSANDKDWKGNCRAPEQGSLKVRFTSALHELADHVKRVEVDLGGLAGKIGDSAEKINKALEDIDAKLDKAKERLDDLKNQDCPNKNDCARKIIAALRDTIVPMNSSYVKIEQNLGAIATTAAAIEAAIKTSHPDIANELDLAIATGRQVVQGAYEAINMFISGDAPAVAAQFLVIKVEYAAATRTLKLFDNGLRPADRLLELRRR